MIKFLAFKKKCLHVSLRRGYTLVEALIYIAVFIIMSSVIIALILSILETSRQVSSVNSLSRGAVSSLEVITREIRSATGVDMVNSVFATSTGVLQLNSLDANGNSRIVKFYLQSGLVKIDQNNVYLGPLSSKDATTTALIFNLSTSTSQNLIKIEADFTSGSGKYNKNDKFYSSVGFRVDN